MEHHRCPTGVGTLGPSKEFRVLGGAQPVRSPRESQMERQDEPGEQNNHLMGSKKMDKDHQVALASLVLMFSFPTHLIPSVLTAFPPRQTLPCQPDGPSPSLSPGTTLSPTLASKGSADLWLESGLQEQTSLRCGPSTVPGFPGHVLARLGLGRLMTRLVNHIGTTCE